MSKYTNENGHLKVVISEMRMDIKKVVISEMRRNSDINQQYTQTNKDNHEHIY